MGLLGSGAMGVVYDVLDRDNGVRLALKTLAAATPEEILRLKAEFRTLRDIRHPNLARLEELFEEDGHWFFTMERVDGLPLLNHLQDIAHSTSLTGGAPDGPLGGMRKPVDVVRLRQCLAQLARGLGAIHRAGKVHRDIKPSNVLVDREGRVVILDFGVATELAGAPEELGEIVGTVHYMAPEQAEGVGVGPAADWYAFGVVLFLALTNALPFTGTGGEVLTAKLLEDAPSPSSLAEGIPGDLSVLCERLLSRSPELRPTEHDVLAALGATGDGVGVGSEGATFVGRAHELATLRRAFEDAASGSAATVFVEGPSGVGKTATVRRALDEAREYGRDFLMLRGRCHEKESVPYNAFDGVVDDLSRFLRRFADDGNHEWVPSTGNALLRVFPVLRSVPVLEELDRAETQSSDSPQDVRRRACTELRDVLSGLASMRPVVIVLDDIHWADADSVALLGDLLAPPRAPAILVIATARPGADGPRAALEVVGDQLQRVVLGGLDRDEGRQLVERLTTLLPGGAPTDIDGIVRETDGHPMFIDALVRHLAHEDAATLQRVCLDDALLGRVDRLADGARSLLELVAVAGAPLSRRVVAEVSALAPSALAAHLGDLQDQRLLRVRGSRHGDAVEPFHDRVREAVYERLATDRRAALHGALATALEMAGAPPELLFTHWSRTSYAERAAVHALAAAKQSEAALAFDRAADLYQFAIDARGHEPDEERALLRAVATMRAQAGRPADAASAYARAARAGTPGRGERLELRRNAVEQYLLGGYLPEARGEVDELLSEVGARLPRSTFGAVLAILWNTVLLSLRSMTWTKRREDELSPELLTRLDIFWSVGAGLVMVDTARGAYFLSRGPLLCLDAGEELRITRSLAGAGMSAAADGNRPRAEALLASARRAATAHGSDLARFYVDFVEGGYAFLLDNDWQRTRRLVAAAGALGRRLGVRTGWEADAIEQFSLWATEYNGSLRELDGHVDARVREAKDQGHRFREVAFRVCFAHLHALLRDDPERAEFECDEALARWQAGRTIVDNVAYWAHKTRMRLYMYRGEVERGWSDRLAERRRFERSLVSRVAVIRSEELMLRIDASLLRAAWAKKRGRPSEMRSEINHVRRHLRAFERSPLSGIRNAVPRIRAGIAALVDDLDSAILGLRASREHERAAGTELHVAVLERALSVMAGGDEGRALFESASAYFAREGIKDPARTTGYLVPGFAHPAWG